jgi:quercetin dioxygenase-like cupin family protein
MTTLTYAIDAPKVQLREGKSHRILVQTDSLLVEEIFFDTGIFSEPHAHDEEQAAYHVTGRFEVDLGGGTITVGPGDGYSIPRQAPHSVRCLEGGSYILVSSLATPAESAVPTGHELGHSHDHEHPHAN